jgi:hypothetical protein
MALVQDSGLGFGNFGFDEEGEASHCQQVKNSCPQISQIFTDLRMGFPQNPRNL